MSEVGRLTDIPSKRETDVIDPYATRVTEAVLSAHALQD